MRRELSLVGVSLLVYACALVLGSLVICETVRASAKSSANGSPKGHAAHVRVERRQTAPDFVCGVVTWLWNPIDTEGRPIRDKHDPDLRLRARPVLGLSLLEDFNASSMRESMEGRIYNPENGRTYRRARSQPVSGAAIAAAAVDASSAFARLGCLALGRLFERCERFLPETIEPAAQSLDAAGVHGIEAARAFHADYD